jgi:DNA-binding CsgD family transcriptional regulator
MQNPRVFANLSRRPITKAGSAAFKVHTRFKSVRKSRAKPHVIWEKIEQESHGLYAESFHKITQKYPMLTPAERRIATLTKATLPNWRIAEKLCISTATVKNHRFNIRRKLGLQKENLALYLIRN